MATLTKGKTFTNGELVTPQKLHELVDLGTVNGIVNADISASAAIADTKLAQITTANKVAQSAVANLTTDLAGKAAASHTHTIANVTGLQTALDGKQAAGSYAAASHTHDDRYYTETEMNTLLAGKQAAGSYAASSHNHDASNITSGTLANARTTATSLSLETYVASNPLDAGAYAGQLLGKIAQFNSSSAAIDSFSIRTFGVTSYSPGANSGVYSINAVSKPGAALVQTYIGGILSNNTNTGVIYGTASDYRLKTNIEPLTDALARLASLPVRRFHWVGHTDSPKVDGFLAHEAQAIVPEAVTGTKDAVDAEGKPIHQGIDQSKLVPLLVAAVQELAARVAALEAR